MTYKEKYNKKYGFKKDTSHSLEDISKTTGKSLKGLKQIFKKGEGAFYTNPQSVRPNVKSSEQWAYARVYSAIMGGKASKVDNKELKMKAKGGLTKGKSHKEGGIPMRVKSTGQNIEVEGGEIIINKYSSADKKKHNFDGEQLTKCEIASKINEADDNGVKIDCDTIVGKKYKYNTGGKIKENDMEKNEIIEMVSDQTQIPKDVIEEFVDDYGIDTDEIEDRVSENFYGQYNSDTDFAYAYVEQLGGVGELGDTADSYFDYEKFGRDLAMDFSEYGDGYYFRNYAKGGFISHFNKGGKLEPSLTPTRYDIDRLMNLPVEEAQEYIIGQKDLEIKRLKGEMERINGIANELFFKEDDGYYADKELDWDIKSYIIEDLFDVSERNSYNVGGYLAVASQVKGIAPKSVDKLDDVVAKQIETRTDPMQRYRDQYAGKRFMGMKIID
jgi:antirestriction protein